MLKRTFISFPSGKTCGGNAQGLTSFLQQGPKSSVQTFRQSNQTTVSSFPTEKHGQVNLSTCSILVEANPPKKVNTSSFCTSSTFSWVLLPHLPWGPHRVQSNLQRTTPCCRPRRGEGRVAGAGAAGTHPVKAHLGRFNDVRLVA